MTEVMMNQNEAVRAHPKRECASPAIEGRPVSELTFRTRTTGGFIARNKLSQSQEDIVKDLLAHTTPESCS